MRAAAHPVLPRAGVYALHPEAALLPLVLLATTVRVLQRLLRLLPRELDAVAAPATKALGYLPHKSPMEPHCVVLL